MGDKTCHFASSVHLLASQGAQRIFKTWAKDRHLAFSVQPNKRAPKRSFLINLQDLRSAAFVWSESGKQRTSRSDHAACGRRRDARRLAAPIKRSGQVGGI